MYEDYINLMNRLNKIPNELDKFKEDPLKYKANHRVRVARMHNELIERVKAIYIYLIKEV